MNINTHLCASLTNAAKQVKSSSCLSGKLHYRCALTLLNCTCVYVCVCMCLHVCVCEWAKCLLAGEPVVDRWCLWEKLAPSILTLGKRSSWTGLLHTNTHTHTHARHASVHMEQQQHTITEPQSRQQQAHCVLLFHKQESHLSVKVLHTQELFYAPEISWEVCWLL